MTFVHFEHSLVGTSALKTWCCYGYSWIEFVPLGCLDSSYFATCELGLCFQRGKPH